MIPGIIDECVRDATGVVFPDESRGVTTRGARTTINIATAMIAMIVIIVPNVKHAIASYWWSGCPIDGDGVDVVASCPPTPPRGGGRIDLTIILVDDDLIRIRDDGTTIRTMIAVVVVEI